MTFLSGFSLKLAGLAGSRLLRGCGASVLLLVAALSPLTSANAQSEAPAGERPALSQFFSLGPGENSYSHQHSSQAKRVASTQDSDIRKAIALINERLALMPDVARFKWNKSLPIEDLERERQLLSRLVRKGVVMGLDPRITQAFFADQITASKMVQSGYYAKWRTKRPAPRFSVPDLATEQRPRIDDVTNRMLHSLVALRNISLRPDGSGALRTAAIAELRNNDAASREVLTTALRPLLQGLPVEKWRSLRPGAPVVAQ